VKLYYATGACSLSPHIALQEAGLAYTLKRVDTKTHKLADGSDFGAINGKGYVPVLELDDGTRLTEGPAIVQYIADLAPQSGLAPANGTFERYRLQEWLNFITSEIHKAFGPLFDPNAAEPVKQWAKERLNKRLEWTAGRLAGRPYLLGERFSVADAYLFTVLNWCKWTGIDLARWPVLVDYVARVGARPKVIAALKAEGLIRAEEPVATA
jgi:glutathione S-transferase